MCVHNFPLYSNVGYIANGKRDMWLLILHHLQADVYAQHGHKELSRPLCIISVVLNMLAIWSVVVCVGIALFAYIYTQE
jgi:hypothetical protein